jgi:DNA polymerase-3 subunit alpha
LQEAFFYNFQIKVPDINYSELNWIKKGNELVMGFSSLKEYKGELFQGIIEERKKRGAYKNWENFLVRTISLWEKMETSTFTEWIKAGLFTSLEIDIDILLKNQGSILCYLQIKKALQADSKNLPFLNLSVEKTANNNWLNNQREHETLGLYISYFSRWKELSQKKNCQIISLLEIFRKIEEYNNQETIINIYAVIFQIESKDEKNYTLLLQDIRNSFKLSIDSNVYQQNKEKLVVHNELLFTLKIEIKKGIITSLNCEEIIII